MRDPNNPGVPSPLNPPTAPPNTPIPPEEPSTPSSANHKKWWYIGGGAGFLLLLLIAALYSDMLGARVIQRNSPRLSVRVGEVVSLDLSPSNSVRKLELCTEKRRLFVLGYIDYTDCQTLKNAVLANETRTTVTIPENFFIPEGQEGQRAVVIARPRDESGQLLPTAPSDEKIALYVIPLPTPEPIGGGGNRGGSDNGGSVVVVPTPTSDTEGASGEEGGTDEDGGLGGASLDPSATPTPSGSPEATPDVTPTPTPTPSSEPEPEPEPESTLSQGLVGYWTFDEASGAAGDSSGNGNTGALHGGTARSTNTAPTNFTNERSTQFDGSNDFIDLPDGIDNGLSGDFSFATWVYWDGPSSETWQRIMDFGDGGTTAGRYMFITPRSGCCGNLTWRFVIKGTTGGGEVQVNGSSTLQTGQWVHLAVVLEGSTVRIYRNGSQENTATTSYRVSQLGAVNNWLGRSQWSLDPYFDGRLDDVRLYNRALSASEISELANGNK